MRKAGKAAIRINRSPLSRTKEYTCVFQLPNPLNPAPLRRKTPALYRFSGSVLRIPLRKSSFSRIRKVSIF